MTEAFIVDGVRTPIGRYAGGLASVRPDDLAALVVREAVARAGVDPELIDEVVLGARQPGRRGQPQRRPDGRAARRAAPVGARLHRQPAVRLGPDRDRHRPADDRGRRRRRRRRRRGRVDDPRALGDREADQGVRPPGRDLRHLDRLAVRQPALRRRHHADHAADRGTRCAAMEPDPRGARRLRAALPRAGPRRDQERPVRGRDGRRRRCATASSPSTRGRAPTPASSGWPRCDRCTAPTGSSRPATPARSTTAPPRSSSRASGSSPSTA